MPESTARILVVDDDPVIRDLLGRRLVAERFRVAVASDGEEALRRIVAGLPNLPDLMICDRMMPRMGGITLVERLRERAETESLPIIMLTAMSGVDGTLQGLDAGADDYVGKPFQFPELLARIHSLLRRSRRSGPASQAPGTSVLAGVTLYSVLQMLNMERKTCTVRVTANARVGRLNIVKGDIVNAECGSLDGEDAAYDILAWPVPEVQIEDAGDHVKTLLRLSLNHLLMESLRRQDESAALPLEYGPVAGPRNHDEHR